MKIKDQKALRLLELACSDPDWQQVALNGGPPCFHLCDDGRFCFRAKRWEGHEDLHKYISFSSFVKSLQ